MLERGMVVTDSGEVIARPGMLLAELLATPLGAAERVTPTGPGWQQAGIGPFSLKGCEMFANAYFHVGRLGLFSLSVSEQELSRRFGPGRREGPEGDEHLFYRAFVEEDLAESRQALPRRWDGVTALFRRFTSRRRDRSVNFEWGYVCAFFDRRAYCAEIAMQYSYARNR